MTEKLLNLICWPVVLPKNIFVALKLRKHGWTRQPDGKWSKQITYGQDNWTLTYSPEAALEEIEKEQEATKWNPANKVVQDHRDGRVDHSRTNIERKKRGLPVPWEPWMAEMEMKGSPIE